MANTIILNPTTTTATGAWFRRAPDIENAITFQATEAGSGAVTGTVTIEVSNDGINACSTVAGTITLSGTNTASNGFTTDAPWGYWRAKITAISGTSAAISVIANGAIQAG